MADAQQESLFELKRKSARGGVVTLLSQGAAITIQLASTVILARLLSPEDYGVIAMVLAVTNFAGVFRDLGLSSAAIQNRDLSRDQQTNLFWINVASGFVLTIIVSAGAPLVVWFYGKPELLWVTVALSTNFFIGSLGSQHGAMLMRNMQFGRRAVATIAGALVTLLVSVIFALMGFSYWALVWGNLSGAATTTLLLVVLSPFRPGYIAHGAETGKMLGFGVNVTAYDFINYFHRNLDNVLIGKFVGTEALGLYSRAYSLLMLPINNLRGPITAVGYPALSRLQDQPEAFRSYYRRMTQMLALIAMPFTAFLFVTSEEIVQLLLGPTWSGVTPLFSVLALVALIQPIITLWGIVVLSQGLGRRYVHIGVFNTASSALGFVAGLPWGVVGVAVGYAIATYLTAIPTLVWAFRGTPVSLSDFFAGVSRACLASIFAAGLTIGFTAQWTEGEIVLRIAVAAGLFISVYLTTIRVLPGGQHEFQVIRDIVTSITRSRVCS